MRLYHFSINAHFTLNMQIRGHWASMALVTRPLVAPHNAQFFIFVEACSITPMKSCTLPEFTLFSEFSLESASPTFTCLADKQPWTLKAGDLSLDASILKWLDRCVPGVNFQYKRLPGYVNVKPLKLVQKVSASFSAACTSPAYLLNFSRYIQ